MQQDYDEYVAMNGYVLVRRSTGHPPPDMDDPHLNRGASAAISAQHQ